MINTENGKRIGKIYIPFHYNEDRVGAIMKYLLIVPTSMETKTYNWEIIGVSIHFDPLNDMDTVPTYDLTIKWIDDKNVSHIELRRIGTHH